jgi:hypothetical protein
VSNDGTLAYIAGPAYGSGAASSFVWFDRDGAHESPIPFRPQQYSSGKISPDARFIIVRVRSEDGAGGLWLGDVVRGTLTPVTTDSVFDYEWSYDGKRIDYRKGDGTVWSRPADLSAQEQRIWLGTALPTGGSVGIPSHDGKSRVLGGPSPNAATGNDIWLATVSASANAQVPVKPWLQTAFQELPVTFSPDGRWLLYVSQSSDQASREQLYAQPFPGPGPVIPITKDGASSSAVWLADKIVFRIPGGGTTTTLMASRVATTPTFTVDDPKPLFQFQRSYVWDGATRDGQRFLFRKDVNAAAQGPPATELHVIVNWIEDVKQKLGTSR